MLFQHSFKLKIDRQKAPGIMINKKKKWTTWGTTGLVQIIMAIINFDAFHRQTEKGVQEKIKIALHVIIIWTGTGSAYHYRVYTLSLFVRPLTLQRFPVLFF